MRICCISMTSTFSFFFFNDTATTEIYTLSLHDALPIFREIADFTQGRDVTVHRKDAVGGRLDRKSTRLNSSHANISYAVFCLKKKKQDFCASTCTCGSAHRLSCRR